jgi:hypothetical protein
MTTLTNHGVSPLKGFAFRLYRVFGYGKDAKIYTIAGPLENSVKLEPVSYRAYVASGEA